MIGCFQILVTLLIDGLVVMAVLRLVSDVEVDLLPAFGLALGAAVGTVIVVSVTTVLFGLIGLGVVGLLLGLVASAVLLGIVVSALFGVEIKRSFLIAVIFMIAHICVGVVMRLIFG